MLGNGDKSTGESPAQPVFLDRFIPEPSASVFRIEQQPTELLYSSASYEEEEYEGKLELIRNIVQKRNAKVLKKHLYY